MNIKEHLLANIPYGFLPSSRIMATLEGSYISNGASCNFRQVQDDVEDILDSMRWAGLISKGQGAPTLDFSLIRPSGSPIASGGTASGVVSFAKMFDAVVSGMRRPGKKNSVGVALLDINHPEIMDRVVDGQPIKGWLSPEVDREFKTVFKGVLIDPETYWQVPVEVRKAVAEAYNNYRIFVCKYEKSSLGNRLYPNVCTEARLINRGTCVLGAINLGLLTAAEVPKAFREAAEWMASYFDNVALPIFRERPDLFDADNPDNRQIGIGVFGMANYLGRHGFPYWKAIDELYAARKDKESAAYPLKTLVKGYREAADVLKDQGFVRGFTVQPTASTAYRATDLEGYACAPEIMPPQAVRRADGCPVYELQSELKGNQTCVLPPYIQTRDEVPYEDFLDFSEEYQRMMNDTGLAHTISHCYYDETFTLGDLGWFVGSPLGSLYYRLDPTDLSLATQKAATWDEVGDLEVEDEPSGSFSLSGDITQRKGYCSVCAGD